MREQMALLPAATRAASPRIPSTRAGAASWELDEHTRQVGRQGLAAARQALREAGTRRAA